MTHCYEKLSIWIWADAARIWIKTVWHEQQAKGDMFLSTSWYTFIHQLLYMIMLSHQRIVCTPSNKCFNGNPPNSNRYTHWLMLNTYHRSSANAPIQFGWDFCRDNTSPTMVKSNWKWFFCMLYNITQINCAFTPRHTASAFAFRLYLATIFNRTDR